MINLTALDFPLGQPSTKRFVSHASGLDCLGQGYPNLNVTVVTWGRLTTAGLATFNWKNIIDHSAMSTAAQDSTTGRFYCKQGCVQWSSACPRQPSIERTSPG